MKIYENTLIFLAVCAAISMVILINMQRCEISHLKAERDIYKSATEDMAEQIDYLLERNNYLENTVDTYIGINDTVLHDLTSNSP